VNLTVISHHVFDVELLTCQHVTQESCARCVLVAGRIDGRDAHQISRELDDLVGRAIHLIDDAIDDVHGWKYNIARTG
jgi:hypothetical protein